MNVSFSETKVWNNEGLVDCAEGETLLLSCKYWTAISAASSVAYKNGQTVTSTIFPSGSVVIADRTATLKPAVFATYGTYVLVVTATIGSETSINKIQVRVQKGKATR